MSFDQVAADAADKIQRAATTASVHTDPEAKAMVAQAAALLALATAAHEISQAIGRTR